MIVLTLSMSFIYSSEHTIFLAAWKVSPGRLLIFRRSACPKYQRQWAGEVISSREKTLPSSAFIALEKDIDARRDGLGK